MVLQKYIKLIIVVLFLTAPLILNAIDLRGRIDGYNRYYQAPYPLARVTVDLYVQDQYGWRQIGRYITGPDGMYYFQNVLYGYNYSIQVNGRQNYPITVFSSPLKQDLPPIILMY